ncbi:sulfatase-like hydrolase/transferase [Bordetella petrii]|uniref:sulfatase-like hydrolase/transferase n=1 Tax=Bordetella petrii TaxID=94624 RepID=UPI001A976F3A|nr:sulfatase-like hydrolase/transferase [Bordetella petrii]MBO1114172.1 sulfatase-like hydrolase/transferase [Bordetella petrii]
MPARHPRPLLAATLAAMAALLAACSDGGSSSDSGSPATPTASARPNILFIVLDDLGVDQMTSYGYGGAAPPRTPTLTAIAQAGVQFRNAWAMPDCTPTRATFFTGRYPSQNNVLNALVATDLANSAPSPYEMTLPKLLKTRGYTSALIGKMHLTGSDLNGGFNLPYGYDSMWKLGWDYFDGFLDGAPYNVDTRAGLTTKGADVDSGPYKCGFIPTTGIDAANGADAGACYFANGSCTPLAIGGDITTPGRSCMERGGILDPGQSCQASVPGYIDFTAQNGYYTGRWVKSTANGDGQVIPASDPSSRGYRSILETDRALEWAGQQPAGQPWMLTVGYSAIHTPLQVPPVSLISDGTPGRNDNLVCSPLADAESTPVLTAFTDLVDAHLITNLMVEAVDRKIGDLLVGLGLARYNADGTLDYHPEKTNTLVVVVGDNGTYVNSVKFTSPGQFDPMRAKASPYQTGVWVPLLVAGPMVASPGREVPHMVGSVDLYRLFADVAGADVDQAAASRPLDAQPMLAYLTKAGQAGIRSTNFTEMGTNLRAVGSADDQYACVIPAANNVCTTLFPQKGVCLAQGGIWYGDNLSSETSGVPATGYHNCCQVQAYRQALGEDTTFLPVATKAVTDGTYKLVRQTRNQCDPAMGTAPDPAAYSYSATGYDVTDELYQIDTATPDPRLDKDGTQLTAVTAPPLDTTSLSTVQQQAYTDLKTEMAQHDAVASYNQDYDTVNCPGDGNHDLVVDQEDLDNWQELSQLNGGQSSWYDFNHDGKTDAADQAIIQGHMGNTCAAS